MKTITFLTFLLLALISCKNPVPKKIYQQPFNLESIIRETVLIGYVNRANLNFLKFQAWFKPEYVNIKIPEGWSANYSPLTKNLEFKLFLSAWCGDTQREFEGIFKLLDLLGISENRIEMDSISEYKDSPLGYEKEFDILNIPTHIFIEDGNELNRIVEFPFESLVEYFSKILKNLPHEDSYADF
jgi:hypothetical protein